MRLDPLEFLHLHKLEQKSENTSSFTSRVLFCNKNLSKFVDFFLNARQFKKKKVFQLFTMCKVWKEREVGKLRNSNFTDKVLSKVAFFVLHQAWRCPSQWLKIPGASCSIKSKNTSASRLIYSCKINFFLYSLSSSCKLRKPEVCCVYMYFLLCLL